MEIIPAILKFTFVLTIVLVGLWSCFLIPLGFVVILGKKDKASTFRKWAKFALKSVFVLWGVLIAGVLLILVAALLFGQFSLET